MIASHSEYYDRAAAAVSRRDYLSAMQYGLRAAGAPRDQAALRCDAQMLLAIISLELGDEEAALAYAVGAHLGACRLGDSDRTQRAEAIVTMVLAQCPHLVENSATHLH